MKFSHIKKAYCKALSRELCLGNVALIPLHRRIRQHVLLLQILEFSSNSTWLLIRSWLFWIQHLPSSVSFGACLEVVWRFEQRTFYIGSLRVELVLVCQEVPKWVWPSVNQNRLLFMQIQTLPPRMHHKWKIIINIVWKIMEDQLPTKSPNENRITILSTQHLSLKVQVNFQIKTMAMKLNTHLV